MGGSNHPSNLQLLCVSCNYRKGPRWVEYRYFNLLTDNFERLEIKQPTRLFFEKIREAIAVSEQQATTKD